jgi:hypothetical protein
MKKTISILFSAVLLLSIAAYVDGCGSSSSSSSSGGGGGGSGVTLTADDFPTVGVCSTGTVDATGDALKTAIAAATSFTFLHKPYASDADIPFICGKQGAWDPSEAGAFDATNVLSPSDLISDILGGAFGSVFICNDGFAFAQGNQGLHGATAFRGELTFDSGGTTYRVRLRFTVTGTDADATLASLGLATTDISLTDGSGTMITTVAELMALFAADPTNIAVNVVANGTTLISATGGVICAGAQ